MELKSARAIHSIFKTKGFSLSVAESCTGGLISHCITALPGASIFFRAGIVAYAVDAKKGLLGIPGNVIAEFGMVSEETAKQMAQRMRRMTRTDFAVSTTGNLGPDVLEQKPKGLIYIAVSTREKTHVKRCLLKGTRGKIKEQAALRALAFLAEVAAND